MVEVPEALRIDLEKFLWRFKDADRNAVSAMSVKFDQIVKLSADDKSLMELDQTGVARLYEAMGDARSIPEIRTIFNVYAINGTKPKRLTFLQLCCSLFDKSFDEFNTIPEDELRRLALEDSLVKSKETEELEAALAARRAKEEAEAKVFFNFCIFTLIIIVVVGEARAT